jgi:hypothetical protein
MYEIIRITSLNISVEEKSYHRPHGQLVQVKPHLKQGTKIKDKVTDPEKS